MGEIRFGFVRSNISRPSILSTNSISYWSSIGSEQRTTGKLIFTSFMKWIYPLIANNRTLGIESKELHCKQDCLQGKKVYNQKWQHNKYVGNSGKLAWRSDLQNDLRLIHNDYKIGLYLRWLPKLGYLREMKYQILQ